MHHTPTDATPKQLFRQYAAMTDAMLLAHARAGGVVLPHLQDAAMAYLERPGKRLRPTLLLLCCAASGGQIEAALPAAAAVELFHTWTLVHDDVIDNDAVRRGAPTVHCAAASWAREQFDQPPGKAAEYGRDVAILAGDMQHAWAVSALLQCSARGVAANTVLDLVRGMTHWLTPRLLEGETLDVQFSFRPLESISSDAVMRMITLKTGVLLEFAARAGAAIAGETGLWGNATADALGRFALECGIAFQLQDDVLGIIGNQQRLGKPVGSDLREGKRTLILLEAMKRADHSRRRRLQEVLGNPDATETDIRQATDILVTLGAVEHARKLAHHYLDSAITQLRKCSLAAEPEKRLLEWADMLVDREF